MRLLAALSLVFCWLPACAWLFDAVPDSTYRYSVTLNGSVSAGAHTPFWLVSNRHGLASLEHDNGYLRAGFYRRADSTRTWRWEFGVDLAVACRYRSAFNVQQLYAGVGWRWLSLTAGARERSPLVGDPLLSSGDLLFSGNARPIPQILLETPQYVAIPGTRCRFAVRVYVSIGMMTDTRWAENFVSSRQRLARNVLFHSKALMFRVGNPERDNFSLEGGMEMGAQWGGSIRRYNAATGEYVYSHMGHSLKDLWHVIVPSSGGDPNDPLQTGEILNCYGNHTGQWTFALNWHPRHSEWGATAYYKHYFEDHSMMTFDYPWRDMLIGLEVDLPANRFVDKVLYEYLHTKFQGGPVYWDHTPEIDSQVSGRDGYYNHGIYNGWEHWGMAIGNPLLRSPIYNANHDLYFYHNRIIAHHGAICGSIIPSLNYRLLLTYIRSWGTYSMPTRDVMRSANALVEVTWHPRRLQGWSGTLSIGADWGGIFGRSAGAMVSITKTGWL